MHLGNISFIDKSKSFDRIRFLLFEIGCRNIIWNAGYVLVIFENFRAWEIVSPGLKYTPFPDNVIYFLYFGFYLRRADPSKSGTFVDYLVQVCQAVVHLLQGFRSEEHTSE